MSATATSTPQTAWSSCSESYLQQGLRDPRFSSCLGNEPSVTVGDPVCGNGIREGDEICDCGTPQVTFRPCLLVASPL